MSKPILVTGGAGFIGSHLIDLFDRENVDYLILDNLSSGSISNIPIAYSKNRLIEGDVKDNLLLEKLISNSSSVFHLACTVGVKNVFANPLETIDTNVNAVRHIASNCAQRNIPLIYFSTSLVYSSFNLRAKLLDENHQIHGLGFNPVSIYVSAKKTGELICDYFRREKGLKYLIIRPFNMIGIRQISESGMVVPTFIESAIKAKTITVYGDGMQTRSFSDVKTAVKILWKLVSTGDLSNQIFNLATTEKSISILKLAETISTIFNNGIEINFIPIEKIYGDSYIDIESRAPSLAKLQKHAGKWEERNFVQILEEIIEYELHN